MRKKIFLILGLIITFGLTYGQTNPLDRISFIKGDWIGTGSGFGNNKSKIESSFQLVMDGKYIEVKNESRFEPTEKNPEGEHHIDNGFMSFDHKRKLIVFRQFNIEGYINQYILNDSLSTDSILVFETESIENFAPGGKARWTIKKVSENEIETIFDVSFPNKEYTCFGTNVLEKRK